jgi:hypothetical protein
MGTTDRMARLLDDTFETLIMAQYNIARHGPGGVETIEVSIISAMTILYCLVTAALAGSWGVLRNLQLTRRASLDSCLQRALCMLFAAESEHVGRVPLVRVLHAAFAPKFGCLYTFIPNSVLNLVWRPVTGVFNRTGCLGFGIRPEWRGSVYGIITPRLQQ